MGIQITQDFSSQINNINNAVPSAMNREFWVSPSGDDTKSGSFNEPLRTLKKACDSIPIGGYGRIHLVGSSSTNYYEISEDIVLYNKTVEIIGDENNRDNVRIYHIEYDTVNHYYTGIRLVNSVVSFKHLSLWTHLGNTNQNKYVNSLIGRHNDMGFGSVGFYNCNIYINVGDCCGVSFGGGFLNIHLYGTTVVRYSSGYLLRLEDSNSCASISVASTSLKEEAGGNLYDIPLSNLIYGISKDNTNTRVLNILSNVEL